MNTCLTCKYWSVNPHMIGSGNCLSIEVRLRTQLSGGFLITAQDFGCNQHCAGEPISNFFPKAIEQEIIDEHLRARTARSVLLDGTRPFPENMGDTKTP